MDFCKTVIHVVQPGDTYYRLAQRYQTTVPDIIIRNPGINPYNLQVGTRIRICSGQVDAPLKKDELDLYNDMRDAWSQHNLWTTMDLVSANFDLPNKTAVYAQLLETPKMIADVYAQFYSQMMVSQLTNLLTEHIRLAGEIFTALRDKKTDDAEMLYYKWEENAQKIARVLSGANSDYSYEGLVKMLEMHLELLKRQMAAQLEGNYDEFVEAVVENSEHLMELSDELSEGLIKQFYQIR